MYFTEPLKIQADLVYNYMGGTRTRKQLEDKIRGYSGWLYKPIPVCNEQAFEIVRGDELIKEEDDLELIKTQSSLANSLY